jgi:NADH:ubiquinone oxidoreductase subunit 6 (subunit J)
MIVEVFSAGLVVAACLAIFLDEAVYSVAALAATFVLMAVLYALAGALFASVFQFVVGVGTLAVLFLSGEMLSQKIVKKASLKSVIPIVVVGALLSLPAIFLSISHPNSVPFSTSFGDTLWNLRAIDVVVQGLVIMTVAIGIVIVLHEKRKGAE